jgi:hypothetical protein
MTDIVFAIVPWIGGVGMVTTVLLPVIGFIYGNTTIWRISSA